MVKELADKDYRLLLHHLMEIDLIAKRLQSAIGSEATIEMVERMKIIKEVIRDDTWS